MKVEPYWNVKQGQELDYETLTVALKQNHIGM